MSLHSACAFGNTRSGSIRFCDSLHRVPASTAVSVLNISLVLFRPLQPSFIVFVDAHSSMAGLFCEGVNDEFTMAQGSII
jgi:hypothetical protein